MWFVLVKTRETHRGQYLIVDFNYGLVYQRQSVTVRYGCNVKGINQSVHFESGDLWVIWTDILTVSGKGILESFLGGSRATLWLALCTNVEFRFLR